MKSTFYAWVACQPNDTITVLSHKPKKSASGWWAWWSAKGTDQIIVDRDRLYDSMFSKFMQDHINQLVPSGFDCNSEPVEVCINVEYDLVSKHLGDDNSLSSIPDEIYLDYTDIEAAIKLLND